MSVNRQDAWNEDDDLILAEVILRHIRDGSTQLKAFDEVAEKLARTAAACGFRWNSVVRKRYEAAIDIARAQRQAMKKKVRNQADKSSQPTKVTKMEHSDEEPKVLTFDDVLKYLKQIKTEYYELKKQNILLEKKMAEYETENKLLREECHSLSKEKNQYDTVSEDYKALIQIMDRARKLTALEEFEEGKPKFKMDLNGNLERV